jgi:hypothetical protein
LIQSSRIKAQAGNSKQKIGGKSIMARLKKAGKEIETAQQRLAGQKSIEEALDLGNNLTNAAYEAKIQEALTALNDYNASLSASDDKLNTYKAKANEVKAYSERSLKAVGVKYGFDSTEYEMAGGTRKSEHKKSKPKTPSKP